MLLINLIHTIFCKEISQSNFIIISSFLLFIYRLTNPLYEDIDHFSSLTSDNSSSKSSLSTNRSEFDNSAPTANSTKISQNKNSFNTRSNFLDRNFNSSWLQAVKSRATEGKVIDWDRLIYNEREEMNFLIREKLINPASEPLTVNFPSIALERASPGHTLSPFILNSPDTEVSIKTSSPESGWSENYAVKNILRLEIAKEHFLSSNHFSSSDYFSASVLKPLYLRTKHSSICSKKCILKSEKYEYLHGITCLICTSQEGYIYHFSALNCEDFNPKCLTTYTFTAPVHHVVLEHTVLHAFTEAGLESYTMRISHHIAKSAIQASESEEICPDVSEPVCLIGLKPFLGIEAILSSRNNIVLLAKADNSWTLYSLRLPNPEEIYVDILNAARNHKSSSSAIYRHLLEEAHAIVRLAKDVRFKPDISEIYSSRDKSKDALNEMSGESRNLLGDFLGIYCKTDSTEKTRNTLDDLYDQSCMLLGDYYIESDLESDWRLSILYYKMSGLTVSEVLSRKSARNAPGLVHFLTETLLSMKSGIEADELFQGHNVVEIIGAENKEGLLKVILGSTVLQQYATEKLIKLLESQECDNYNRLALVLLYSEAGKEEKLEGVLEPISEVFIQQMILEYPHLLFDDSNINMKTSETLSFSNFSGALMRYKPSVFAEILTQLIREDILSLHQIMQVFLEYLPSRVGRDGHDAATALQLFIEVYLKKYFKIDGLNKKKKVIYDFAMVEAFKILVRSYLGKLVQSRVYNIKDEKKDKKEVNKIYLFANSRPPYLNKMPPCSKDYGDDLNASVLEKLDEEETNLNVRREILKLQALMASGCLPVESLQEISQFLETEEVDGSLSLKTLCNENIEVITKMLIEKCPQVILFYAKVRIINYLAIKCIHFLRITK